MKKRTIKKSLKQKTYIHQEILLELWENAIFNSDMLKTLSYVLEQIANTDKSITSIEHILFSEKVFIELTTLRNRNLIQRSQQERLRDCVVGFIGLSVGSHAATTWLMESRAKIIKIADPDVISPSNLNRLRVGWDAIGESKLSIVEKQLQTINPFTKISMLRKTSKRDLSTFLVENQSVHLIVDAIDDMQGKITLREYAKQFKIPLISAADVGDNVILDVERYDLTPQPEMFLGRIPRIASIDFTKLSDIDRKKLIIQLVGFESNSAPLLDSLLSLGKSLSTWPQLGATATIAGGVVATTIKKIILEENVPSGRYYISLDAILVPDFNSDNNKAIRNQKIEEIKKRFQLDSHI